MDLDPRIVVALLALAGTCILAGGAVLGHFLTTRTQRKVAAMTTNIEERRLENLLIDQLQEEVKRLAERATAQDTRMERIERENRKVQALNTELTEEKVALVDYAQQLRQHIIDGHEPPPPTWPTRVKI